MISKRKVLIAAAALSAFLGGAAYALVSQEYVDPTGAKSWVATVLGYVDVSGRAQSVSAANPMPVGVTSGSLTIAPLDVAIVTTGGTAVTALNAGHRNKGGFLLNPEDATINLCVNEQAAASGTISAGALICLAPGQGYPLAASTAGVSVVTSDSAHPFAGQGYH